MKKWFHSLPTKASERNDIFGQSVFLKNWPTPASLFIYFRSFQTNIITNFTTNYCPSSIRCRDSNPRPLEHESPPISTRPGLPSKVFLAEHLVQFFYNVIRAFSVTHKLLFKISKTRLLTCTLTGEVSLCDWSAV